ncbi:hypothetical protein AKJ37_04065 [candidate division MSBL1 archaeon SCGC-AAA259I09]|uniref:RNA polymerase sigma factor 70 region 4 type 2 domain-containing protein n=1 Tax=candidate division MSBL1 archaeon SCGC-AAA259I09 TaxID=1698267 RepID=A0A133URV0_9EURY|nr:hypothetical protein AKJ37_04065 [candidate division MSBL1 archaeon SCGC-AAA259I09]
MSENRQREIAVLRGLGYSQAEIAEKLGISQSQVQYRLSNLKEQTQQKGVDSVLGSLGLRRGPKSEEDLGRKVSKILDGFGVEYTRNKRLGGELLLDQLDFLIEAGDGEKIAVEVKVVPSDESSETLRSAAFTSQFLKKKLRSLKYVLVVGGSGAEDLTSGLGEELKEAGYFDEVFLEDKLDEFERYVEKELEGGGA